MSVDAAYERVMVCAEGWDKLGGLEKLEVTVREYGLAVHEDAGKLVVALLQRHPYLTEWWLAEGHIPWDALRARLEALGKVCPACHGEGGGLGTDANQNVAWHPCQRCSPGEPVLHEGEAMALPAEKEGEGNG